MGTGADDQGDAAGMRKIVRRRGFALANLIDGPLWKEVFLDTSSIVGTLFCIKGVGSLISVGGWADIWCQLLADKDPHTVYVVGSIMVLLLVYWVPATLYTLVDLFRPACLYKYKVQAPDSQFPLSTSALLNTIALVLFNQVSMGLVGCEVSWWLRYRWVNMDTPLHVLPSFPRMMAELMAFLVIFDTLFYYCHRLLHTRNFYKFFHRCCYDGGAVHLYDKVAQSYHQVPQEPPHLESPHCCSHCLWPSGGLLLTLCFACCAWSNFG